MISHPYGSVKVLPKNDEAKEVFEGLESPRGFWTWMYILKPLTPHEDTIASEPIFEVILTIGLVLMWSKATPTSITYSVQPVELFPQRLTE